MVLHSIYFAPAQLDGVHLMSIPCVNIPGFPCRFDKTYMYVVDQITYESRMACVLHTHSLACSKGTINVVKVDVRGNPKDCGNG